MNDDGDDDNETAAVVLRIYTASSLKTGIT